MSLKKKILSYILSFLLVFYTLPITAFASEINQSLPEVKTTTSESPSEISEKKIIGEIQEKREANIKHFYMGDGSYQAVVYPYNVHYKENGIWQDIDNTLKDSSDENNQGILENNKNSFKIKISKNTDSSNLVRIQKANYEISWNIEGINKTKCEPVILDTEKQEELINNDVEDTISSEYSDKTQEEKNKIKDILHSNKKITTLFNTESKARITDAFSGVDIYYDISGDSLKENFVINKPMDNPVFKINLNTKNLEPKLNDDGIITFYDNDKEVFQINTPFLYDCAGEENRNVVQKLEKQKNGYLLTIEMDKEWLNDSKRVYPITLDPSIETPSSVTSISDAFVASGLPNNNYYNALLLGVGYGSLSKTTRSYIKFTLPSLKTGDMVTNARLYLYLYTPNSTPHQINVHKVNGNWSSGTITWNNKPAYNSNIEDYDIVSGSSGSQFNWNITGIVKQWYTTGNNYGLMLKSNNESSGYDEFYSSDCSSAYVYARPSAAIYYVNNSGLESYWTYHSQDVGRAGTGYVNDYNGNLIFTHNDTSLNGNRMPVSISHVYNSNDRAGSIGYGLGWRLNYSQRVVSKTFSDGLHYLYTDEDGTIHDFKSISGVYKDQSGLDLTLVKNSDTTYTITDKKGNKLKFTSTGYLWTITDSNNNTITLSYSGATLKTITDGAGRVFTLDVLTNGYLVGVIDPAGRRTSFAYTGIQLTKITYPDEKYTTYTYDTDNKLLSATNYDGYRISYQYYAAAPHRVNKIIESNSDGTSGQELSISYGNNVTTFTDYLGRKNIYNFNYWGNTMGIKDNEGYAEYYKYSATNTNKLSLQSKLQKTVINYLQNHNAEQLSYWTADYWTGSTGSCSFDGTNKYLGNQSLKVTKTSNTSRHFYSQTLSLAKGKTYTLSGYIKTSGITSVNGKGAAVFVNYQNSIGTWQTLDSTYVSGTMDWERYEVTFTLPSDAASNTVYARAGIIEEAGTAYFDCLQLEDGSIANRYNILENSDLKYGSGIPNFWTKNADCSTSDTLMATSDSNHPASLDNNVFKMTGAYGKNKILCETINLSGKKDDTFVVAGWAQGSSVPTDSSRLFALDFKIVDASGGTKFYVVPFNPDSSDWQYVSEKIIADRDFVSVTFYCLYYQNANTAYFDGLQLYKEEFGQSYIYDPNGNVVSTKDLAKQESTFAYINNDLTKSTDPKGNSFTYNYDGKHNILNATSAENVVYSFTYDSYGNPLTSKVGGSTLYIDSSASYTASGNYIKTIKDASGNTATYNTDETKGNLTSITDAKGKTTSYTYDSNTDNLTSVSKTVSGNNITNSYSYVNDRINTITHNGFNYNFEYDKLGNNTTVNVGIQNLITNLYEARSSKLLKTTYGNGGYISYEYDNLDRITAKKVGEVTKFTYEYNASGNLGYVNDVENGVKYNYTYDLADRLVKVAGSNGSSYGFSYDANNNSSKVDEKVGVSSFSTSYTYDKDNKLKEVLFGGNKKSTNTYDAVGRLTGKSIYTGSTTYNTSIGYKTGVNGSSTAQVATISNNGSGITYTYDANGNIETITENSKVIRYTYDELNEVTREDNQILNKTITYSYDAGGNILSKSEHPYTTGTVGTATKVYNYSYGDSNWKDKLTNYDGKAITYDAIGNPLTYNGYTYTWEAGRQLKGISGNGKAITYKYNDSGIRTQKTVNGVTTKYYISGDKVTYESNGTDNIHYTYDSSGNLVSMNLNGMEYYYIRNAQSDIIGLIDDNGIQVVSYTYDTWGKLISIDGTLKDTLGVKNPYRYRGYRYDTETGLYYLQSRYYNPEWGRFINADAVAGNIGELLGHNIFIYTKNNPVNMSDTNGFRPIYSQSITPEDETDEMIEASLSNMSTANKSRYRQKHKYDNIKGVARGLAISTGFSIGESVAAEATLGYIRIPYGDMPIPVKLSTFENVGRFFKVVGIIALFSSVQNNFSGKYSNSEAWIRTAIDVGAFAAGIAFTAGGGWAAVGIGLGIGLAAESVKYGLDTVVYKKQVTY